ncbi:hypothetical protein SDC9_94706 [bioreactor metagenome]|uniref:Uncharacterized protein n=1 Tax=bioreactor metagenome TaxID=1076179 RepID=A0A645A470_9ZZZZ
MGDPGVDTGLVGGVLGHRRVPLEVVLFDVEDGRRVHRQAVRPVQLEAGQFDGEGVVRLGVEHGLHHRLADVAAGDGAQAGGLQHRLEHLGGGRLAVGAGDGQPGRGVLRVLESPGELHLAVDRHPAQRRSGQQRGARLPAGGGDDEVDVLGQGGGGAGSEPDLGAEDLEDLGALGDLLVVGLVEDDDPGAELQQGVGGGEAGGAQAGHHDPGLRPRGETVGGADPVGPYAVHWSPNPVTHSP